MENTLNLLMKDTTLKWYAVVNGRPVGPLSAKEIVQRLQGNELNFASHLWKEGFSGWTRIYEIIDFKPLMPPEPATQLIGEIQKSTQVAPPPLSPKQKEELRTWFVHIDDTQYGPLSDVEILTLIQNGRMSASTYMWQKGFSDWQQAVNIPVWSKHLASGSVAADFAKNAGKEAEKSAEKKDKRDTPRKPFEAKILLTDGKEVGWAICRDISVGGMQVLMDHVPGSVGAVLKLNVTTHGSVPSFACEGSIVRVLEDGRGFSFRFNALSAEAKQAIEKYIQS